MDVYDLAAKKINCCTKRPFKTTQRRQLIQRCYTTASRTFDVSRLEAYTTATIIQRIVAERPICLNSQ